MHTPDLQRRIVLRTQTLESHRFPTFFASHPLTAVEASEAAGVYVVIQMHNTTRHKLPATKAAWKNVWQQSSWQSCVDSKNASQHYQLSPKARRPLRLLMNARMLNCRLGRLKPMVYTR
jgi:hypothetical protein